MKLFLEKLLDILKHSCASVVGKLKRREIHKPTSSLKTRESPLFKTVSVYDMGLNKGFLYGKVIGNCIVIGSGI